MTLAPKRIQMQPTCAVSSQFIDDVHLLSLNFTKETLGLSHKAEVLINLPHAVTLVVLLDRRVPLAGYLTQKDILEEVITFHDAAKNKTRQMFLSLWHLSVAVTYDVQCSEVFVYFEESWSIGYTRKWHFLLQSAEKCSNPRV